MGIVATRSRAAKPDIRATLAAVAALPECDLFVRSVLATFLAGKLERDRTLEELLTERAMVSGRSTHPNRITRWTRMAECSALHAVCDALVGRRQSTPLTQAAEHLAKIERAQRRAATTR